MQFEIHQNDDSCQPSPADHILTLIYNLSGGNTPQESERQRHDDALKRVLGSERIPDASTLGKVLWRFGDRRRERHGLALKELRESTEAIRAKKRRGFGWKRWNRSGLHEQLGLYGDYRARWPQAAAKALPTRKAGHPLT